MKVYALYLPQFHKVPENEAWWGRDFTDWVSTKNGTPLFGGHYQPHIPLNNNYYNLLDHDVMKWQSELMHEYLVDGLCFYHYWFKDGKQMLEKPAQNLLKWKDIEMPFCFCWANTSWARSWAKMKDADFWINEDEVQVTNDGKALLIEQTYGGKKQWKEHFEYLLEFFRDPRYIRVDEKPLVWIYRSDLVDCLEEMASYWRELAVESGLKGIYLIGSYYQPQNINNLDAAVIYEPGEVLPKVNYFTNPGSDVAIYDYDQYWKRSIKIDYGGVRTYYTGLVNYDDTPRQGNNGHVVSGNPEKFEKWLKILMKKSEERGNEFLFLNAWNEWGEGNHLEPDEKYRYGYLEAIRNAKQNYKMVDLNDHKIISYTNEQLEDLRQYQNDAMRNFANFDTLSKWMRVKQKGFSLCNHSALKNVSHVAIYGYGTLGKLLKQELESGNIVVDFYLDQKWEQLGGKDQVYWVDAFPPVNLIIISTPYYYDEVTNLFQLKKIENYILLDELITELEMS